MQQYPTVAEMLADKQRWTQHAFARDAKGHGVPPLSPAAVCVCLSTAIRLVYSGRGKVNAHDAIHEATGEHPMVFNDTHTHEEVLELVRRLKL